MEAYTLKKKKNTDEFHLFEGEMTEKSCTSKNKSMCGMMEKEKDFGGNKFQCLDEQQARLECAKIGRQVCGNCVSQLYSNY